MAVQTKRRSPDGGAGESTTHVFEARTRVAKVEHFTPAERAARGKAQRAEVPRTSHAGWQAPPTRADPVAILEAQATSRVQDLLPIRYGRMLVSPFTFYRGAAAIMAADLAPGPRTGLHTSSAATPISATSARTRRPTAGSCSGSTTSTRRSRGRSSGT